MRGKYFTLSLLDDSAKVAKWQTFRHSRAIDGDISRAIDVLCKLPYFIGEKLEPKDAAKSVRSLCYVHYVQAPYTFRSLLTLYQQGYYLEAIVLYRHLLEVFVQLRYFHDHPEEYTAHILNSPRVSFKKMFESFSSGFYASHYSRQYSEAAHGIIQKSYFRFRPDGQDMNRWLAVDLMKTKLCTCVIVLFRCCMAFSDTIQQCIQRRLWPMTGGQGCL